MNHRKPTVPAELTPSELSSPELDLTPATPPVPDSAPHNSGGESGGKTACIIGAGFGGMALAIRLQSAGIQTTLIEARDKPGGCAYYWEKEGFTFDAGPTIITDPPCLEELWALSGHDMKDDVELMKVSPFYRLNWPDGYNFDYSNVETQLHMEIAKLEPADIAGYQSFLDYSEQAYEEGYVKLGSAPFLSFKSMAKSAPALAKSQAWRSLYSVVSGFIKNEKLREALTFHTLLMGGNPFKTSALYALFHKLEKDRGIWWVRGGTNRLAAGMARHFRRLGGTMIMGDPVVQIQTMGARATGVETKSGLTQNFHIIASNGDIIHTYRDLLSGNNRGRDYAQKLRKKTFSHGLFVVHFGLEGAWPGIPHHMMLFGPRYRGLMDDIFDHGVLPQDFCIYLHHPTVTDPSMAPKGKSTFYAMVPVANMGKLAVDWDEVGPVLEQRILDEIGRRLIPDIHDRIVPNSRYTRKNFKEDLNAHLGSPFCMEPTFRQSAAFRAHRRDDVIENLYLVGAATHPGAGIPNVMGSAKATARLMIEDLAK